MIKYFFWMALFCAFNLIVPETAHSYNLVSPEGAFSIQIPGKPSFSTENHKSFVGSVKESTYRWQGKTGNYSVSFSELPGVSVTLGGAGTIYGKAKEGLLKEAGGKEVSFSEIPFEEKSGRELVFEIPANGDGPKMMGKARFFLKEKRLYVLVATSPNKVSSQVDSFLQSFKVTGAS